MIDPTSASSNEEDVMIQGELALPNNILRLSSSSQYFPRP